MNFPLITNLIVSYRLWCLVFSFSPDFKRIMKFYFVFPLSVSFTSVQSLSRVQLFVTPLPHTRLPCPSPNPRTYSNSCPLSRWCHLTISSSVIPFSSCLQSFPASGSFPVSQFFTSGEQSIGVSASASVLPMNVQDWFPLGWTEYLLYKESRTLQMNSWFFTFWYICLLFPLFPHTAGCHLQCLFPSCGRREHSTFHH